MVSDRQVRLLRKKRMEGKTLETAAASAGMSERTARTWQKGPLPSEAKTPRTWRTRPDPFAAVWGYHDDRDILWITNEHYLRQKALSYHAARIPREVTWYCDPPGANERKEQIGRAHV